MLLRTLIAPVVFACALLLSGPVAADNTDARAELIGLWTKMFDTRDLAFSATVATTDKKGKVMHSEMRANWPDKFHIKSQDSEFIIIGDGTWMRPAGQPWMKFPMSMSKIIDAYKPEMMKASMEGTTNVHYLKDESVNGRDCKVFTYDFDIKMMGFRSQGSSTIYLDKANGYPVRVESDGEAMGSRSKTVVDYTYDPGIRIVAPN